MKKKYVNVIIIGILLLTIVGAVSLVSAEEIPTVSVEGFNFISWFKHTFNIQDFTIVGQDRSCDGYVKTGNTLYFNHGDLMDIRASDGGCSYALIDVFNQNWNPIGEWKDSFKSYCGSTIGCIVEIYCCPHPECISDTQCEDWEGSGSDCKTKYAVDPYMPLKDENHNTITFYKYCTASCTGPAITCWREEGGVCVSRTYDCSYGTYPNCPTTYKYTSKSECESNILTCNLEGQSCGGPSYLQSGQPCCIGLDCQNFQCVPTGTCSSGQTKCEGQVYYICTDGTFKSQGLVDGKCGYEPLPLVCSTITNQADCEANNCLWDVSLLGLKAECVDKNGEPVNLDAVIYDIIAPTSVKPGEEFIVEFKVKNKGDTGDYLLEAGIIPKETADTWGFKYGILDWLGVQFKTECCPNQPNIFAKTTQLTSGEIDTVKIKIPQAPYEGIRDLCFDNVYWVGEGAYVLYITMKTGCWPEGKEVTYETKVVIINSSLEDDEIVLPKSSTITWTEFYSIDDDKFSQKDYSCTLTVECPLKEGYNVSCSDDEIFKDRTFKIYKESCDKGLGFIDELMYGSMYISTLGLIKADICSWISKGRVFYEDKTKGAGTCLAESNKWYGKLWEDTLKLFGGMGFPTQYVMIITLMILITLIGVLIRMVT